MVDEQQQPPLPEASFLNFLSGLASQGLMQLGEIPNPQSGQRERNLPFARYTLNLLEVLRDKTAGNRDAEEDRYLEAAIEDLSQRLERMESG